MRCNQESKESRCGATSSSSRVLLASAAPAQEAADKRLRLTIYNSDLALVEHVRPLTLAAGRHRIEFAGVSAQILSQTVSFAGAGLSVIEQNFDYDLLTPQSSWRRPSANACASCARIPARGEETEETAEVLSTVGGVVLRIGDRIEVLREDGIPARVIFDEVPPNLRANPTLSILANAPAPVNGDVTLAYLTRGLSWSADYVAVFEEAQGNVSLQGWITLTNNSGTTFANANAQLVAGDINVVGSEAEWWQVYDIRRNNANVRRAGVEASGREQLADYYVYPLAEQTTIANNQTKQVSFLVRRARARRPRLRADVLLVLLAGRARLGRGARAVLELASAAGSAISCRAASCASMRAMRAASRSSSARTASATRARAPTWRSRSATRSTSRSSRRCAKRRARRGARRTTTCRISCATRARSRHRDDPPGQPLALQRGRRGVDRGPAHGRRQLRVGRAGARERRDRAHVHDSPKLVSARRAALVLAAALRRRRCRRARKTRSRSPRRAPTPSP